MHRTRPHLAHLKATARVLALPVLLFVTLACMWDHGGPDPAHAFAAIIGYLSLLALWMVAALLLQWWRARASLPPRPRSGGPPPAPSPAGLPIGPRRPTPLVARAIPAAPRRGKAF